MKAVRGFFVFLKIITALFSIMLAAIAGILTSDAKEFEYDYPIWITEQGEILDREVVAICPIKVGEERLVFEYIQKGMHTWYWDDQPYGWNKSVVQYNEKAGGIYFKGLKEGETLVRIISAHTLDNKTLLKTMSLEEIDQRHTNYKIILKVI